MLQYVNRFEKKIHDLKLTRHVTLQTAPQIRLIQETNEILADKIQSSIVNTVPMWKQQMSLALMIDRQKQATQLQKSVTDANNELMQNVSEMLKQSSTDVAIEAERSVIDIEILQKVPHRFLGAKPKEPFGTKGSLIKDCSIGSGLFCRILISNPFLFMNFTQGGLFIARHLLF